MLTKNYFCLIKNFKYLKSNNSIFKYCTNKSNSFFITTPIFYVNSKPHLGHLYTLIVTDAYYKFEKLLDNKSIYIFSTGTDEHGLKIEKAAKEKKLDCQIFCDQISKTYLDLCKSFSIDFTHFIRTTYLYHEKIVHKVWNQLNEKNYIYKSKYCGWYSINDEYFVPSKRIMNATNYKKELIKLIENSDYLKESKLKFENPYKMLESLDEKLKNLNKNTDEIQIDIESGNFLEYFEEENYMFKLNLVKSKLIEFFKKNPNFVRPAHLTNFLINQLNDNYTDISISRSKERSLWGIPVPNDSDQIIYVWFDALCNYLTVANYDNLEKFVWPPSIQVIGKDILTFHGIYWTAFLTALNLPMPNVLHCHSHWLKDDIKMSKSRGNIVNPLDYINKYKSDGFRYFLLRTASPHKDGNFSDKNLTVYINAELSNKLGNLLQRSTNKNINYKRDYPKPPDNFLQDHLPINNLLDYIETLGDKVYNHYKVGNFHLGITLIMKLLDLCNKFFFDTEPWKLKSSTNLTDFQKLNVILFTTYECLRICAILLYPIVPECSDKIFKKLNIDLNKRLWKYSKIEKKSYEKDIVHKLSDDNIVLYPKIYN